MRTVVAGLLTAAVLGLMVRSAMIRPAAERAAVDQAVAPIDGPLEVVATAPGRTGDEPDAGAEARVRDLMADAKAGDVDAYLAAFDDELRDRLGREVDEQGREAFGRRLREAGGARKSHAVFAPEPVGPDRVRVTVEAVYPDRNERQTFLLRREAGRWLVADVETVRGRQPETRYGTPASFVPPEAPPELAAPGGG